MSSCVLKFQRLTPDAIVPTRATEGSACFDLYSSTDTWLKHYRPTVVVPTGIAVEIPPGYVGLVCSRSGLAAKENVFVLNSPGIIDSDYRGELKIILSHQATDQAWPDMNPKGFPKGSRLAQLMILPLPQLTVEVVDELTTTNRGAGGLGSTGV